MPISAGLYNNTLTLQVLTETADGQGGSTTTWADSTIFRARISSLSAQEKMAQDRTTTIATHKIYCNNMTVTTADRIKWDTVYFEITGIVNPSEAYDHLEITVRELVA